VLPVHCAAYTRTRGESVCNGCRSEREKVKRCIPRGYKGPTLAAIGLASPLSRGNVGFPGGEGKGCADEARERRRHELRTGRRAPRATFGERERGFTPVFLALEGELGGPRVALPGGKTKTARAPTEEALSTAVRPRVKR